MIDNSPPVSRTYRLKVASMWKNKKNNFAWFSETRISRKSGLQLYLLTNGSLLAPSTDRTITSVDAYIFASDL